MNIKIEDNELLPFIPTIERLPATKGAYFCKLSTGEELWLWYDLMEFQLQKRIYGDATVDYWKERTDKRKEIEL
jgi:hypothetical protein